MKIHIPNIKGWIRQLPNRKHYIDFVAALITIPVLLTVLVSNISNIQQKKNSTSNQSAPVIINNPTSKQPVNYNVSLMPSATITPPIASAAPSSICQNGIGHINISYPNEGQIVSDNPVCVTIDYQSSTYCSVVWSYSINNGAWSDYSNNAPCLYNMPSGNVAFSLRVKSLASQNQITLQRNFTYTNNSAVPTPTPSPSPTPTQTPTPTLSPTSVTAQ